MVNGIQQQIIIIFLLLLFFFKLTLLPQKEQQIWWCQGWGPVQQQIDMTAYLLINIFNTFLLKSWWLVDGDLSLFDFRQRKEILYLMTHSTYIIYGYMASDIW